MTFVTDGRITRSLLKSQSGEFDLESIHSLVLADMGITDLGCIGECASLETLDLSKNDLSRLIQLSGLLNLVILDLSANRISSLEGLQAMDNLMTLNVAGNLIGSVETLRALSCLENFRELRMKDSVTELTNPLCMNTSYKKDTLTMLPNLAVLDGERLTGKGSELYKLCEELDRGLNGNVSRDGPVRETPMPSPWIPSGYWEKRETAFDKSILADAEKQLEDLLAGCKLQIEASEETLEEMSSQRKGSKS